jgi:hypothetical protein
MSPVRVSLLATDGIHTTKRAPVAELPSDVTMMVAGTPGVLARFQPQQSESVAAAVRHIRQQMVQQ